MVMPGLIPACAGKTFSFEFFNITVPAHPRVCGENSVKEASFPFQPGSSPRVRGKRLARGFRGINRGLIPACAGKTPREGLRYTNPWAHPRVCGENIDIVSRVDSAKGSSPRVRGKHHFIDGFHDFLRLIPACAGKTSSWLLTSSMRRAHPRVCGENVLAAVGSESLLGSSPRVRGKLTVPTVLSEPWKAHPRVCGENFDHDIWLW